MPFDFMPSCIMASHRYAHHPGHSQRDFSQKWAGISIMLLNLHNYELNCKPLFFIITKYLTEYLERKIYQYTYTSPCGSSFLLRDVTFLEGHLMTKYFMRTRKKFQISCSLVTLWSHFLHITLAKQVARVPLGSSKSRVWKPFLSRDRENIFVGHVRWSPL